MILFGVATVESSSIRKQAQFDGMLDYGAESTSLIARNLMNKDEVIRLDNDEEIVIIRGYKAFKCKKLRYWNYRLGENIEQKSIENYQPKNKEKLKSFEEEKKEEKLPTFEEFLKVRRRRN